ncbi:MAG: hypothetical protein KC684_02085 [Candidatus Omnitrophica bacterium]|nr:hypothetical protein [Candidatus Omnitrophota bacterium]
MILLYLISFCFAPLASADIYKYTDENGNDYYVNNINSVPDKYKDQLNNVLETDDNAPKNSAYRAPQGYSQEQTKKKSVKNKDVEIFVTSWCGYCRKLEAFLKKNRIKYKKYDIEKSAYGKKRHQELGGGGIPVTTIGDTVVRGYDPATIQRLLDS